jgi:hypothetical protein
MYGEIYRQTQYLGYVPNYTLLFVWTAPLFSHGNTLNTLYIFTTNTRFYHSQNADILLETGRQTDRSVFANIWSILCHSIKKKLEELYECSQCAGSHCILHAGDCTDKVCSASVTALSNRLLARNI